MFFRIRSEGILFDLLYFYVSDNHGAGSFTNEDRNGVEDAHVGLSSILSGSEFAQWARTVGGASLTDGYCLEPLRGEGFVFTTLR